MSRRLYISMLALVTAFLVVAGGAFARPAPIPQVAPSQSSIFKAIPCLNAPKLGGSISSALQVTQGTGSIGRKGLKADLHAGLLFVYQPNDPTQASYTGLQVIDQHVLVPVGTASLDFPVTLPLVGSDGSVSAVTTTATAIFTPVASKLAVDVTIGEFACSSSPLQPAVAPVDPTVTNALGVLAATLTQPGAASAVTYWAANGSNGALRTWTTLLGSTTAAAQLDALLAGPHVADALTLLNSYLGQVNTSSAADAAAKQASGD